MVGGVVWWCGGVVVWWCGGVVVWWCVGDVVVVVVSGVVVWLMFRLIQCQVQVFACSKTVFRFNS